MNDSDAPSAQRGPATPNDRASRLLLVWTMLVGVFLAGLAFAYKIAGFVFTLSSPDFRGTFDISIVVYFFVTGGWLCLLVWCLLAGKFKRMERAKYDLLRQEEEYDRQGI
jgi:hypothetical protein